MMAAAGLALAVVQGAGPAAAQVGNGATPAAIPAVGPTAITIPPPPVVALPSPTPTPLATAAATPRPAATRTPAARPSATPSPSPSPAPSPSASPTPAASPTAVTPTAAAVPAPQETPSPAPSATPQPLPPADADDGAGHYWLAALAAGAIALAALAWALLRRRRAGTVAYVEEQARVEEPPVARTPAEPVARARLALDFRPKRAGVNLLSATSENEIVLTNIGDAPAESVRVHVRLFSAHAGQDADLAAFYAEPIARPAVAAFTLAPGEARTMSTIAALPREAIRTLTAAGRPMFVPIVAVNIVYASGESGGGGQLAQAFAVGIERVDSPKLAPFWLDTPPRTFDQVAARPHAAAVER